MLFASKGKKIYLIDKKIKKNEVDLNIIKINIEKTIISIKNIENKIKAYKNIASDYEVKGAIALSRNKDDLYRLAIKKGNDIYKEINLLQFDYVNTTKKLNSLRKKESALEKKILRLKNKKDTYTNE